MSLTFTKNGQPVSGAAVTWKTTAGTLSTESGKTGAAGGATTKLSSNAAGAAVVTATVNGVEATTESITFNAANVAVTGVTIDPATADVAIGAKVKLAATVAPTNATNKAVKFTTSDAAIATVDEATGEVTGVAAGAADITVTTMDGNKTAVSKVTVPTA
ncbi:Ig-like domain-containing protein [Obesumbacterium proteus]|uniref:Ig-like domain-containing protein n=1 Tax=Obesumbacterium proteus TaxID=82983 RepID=UPI0009EEE47C|nr:Ig-like domain-containing protein [Obesumbacterium proteus]